MTSNEIAAGGTDELQWFKSSYSGAEGGECLEAAWAKSSYSSNEGGECVEVAADGGPRILVRDSKDTRIPHLSFGSAGWATFVEHVASR